jgi:hypothetical protein
MTMPQQQSTQDLQANRQPPAQFDYDALALAQRFIDIRDKHLACGAGPWSAALVRLADACTGVTTRAGRLDSIAPPAWVEHLPAVAWQPGGVRGRADSTWTREKVTATPYQLQVLEVAQGMRDDLVKQHGNEYKTIIDQATAACVPPEVGVLTAATTKVADLVRELTTAIASLPAGGTARNAAAQRLLNQAIADDNATLLHVLLGGPMDLAWLAFGDVSVQTLRKVYAASVAKSNAALQRMNPPAIELLSLQDGDYALSGLVPAAVAYFDHEMGQTRAYLRG